MRIQIKVVLEAKDDMDVEAMRPDYLCTGNTWDDAIACIGRLQRKVERRLVDATMDDNSDVEADPIEIVKEND